MRLSPLFIILTTVLPFTLMACGVPKDIYEEAVEERTISQNTITNLNAEISALTVELESQNTTLAALNNDKSRLEQEQLSALSKISELENTKLSTQKTIAQLQEDKQTVQSALAEEKQVTERLEQVYPPKRFKDKAEIESWLRDDDISDRGLPETAETLYLYALELRLRALSDGYIVGAYVIPDFTQDSISAAEYGQRWDVFNSAVTQKDDLFYWVPDSDDPILIFDINRFH